MSRALRSPLLFILSALTILAVAIALVRSRAYVQNPDVAAWGVTFDLTITIPLLYWLFVVRTGRASATSLAPVSVLCLIAAAFVVPKPHQQFLGDLTLLAIPLELLTIALVVRNVRRDDTLVGRVVRSEIAVMRYALFAWREQPQRDARSLTVHERSGWGTIVACILVLLVAESIGLHLLIQLWSVPAAWIVTFLDIWGMLWLVGDYHALRLRHSSIDPDALRIRYGLRWSLDIPRENIASIDPITSEADWKRPDVLKMAILEAPRYLIRLRDPQTAEGLAGLRKTITAIAILPDDLAAFESALAVSRA